jgi:glycosyltransferase involved in cell wall biosynthesis
MNDTADIQNSSHILAPWASVIIPFCGAKYELANCVKGLRDQYFQKPFETIIVASGNNRDIKELNDILPNLKMICSDAILYPGKARNIGVRNATAKFLVFIDADCVPTADWLSELYSSFIKGNEIVIGPIVNLHPFHPVASVDNLLQFPDFQRLRPSKNISHFPACNLGISKELFFKAGYFIEEVITGEDVKFSMEAIRKCRGKIEFNQKALVKHSGRKGYGGFIKHNENLGFYRGYLSLKLRSDSISERNSILYSLFFGFKRFVYITIRTLQWNPVGTLRIALCLPLCVLGLISWTKGFWKGNNKYCAEKVEQPGRLGKPGKVEN